MRFRIILSVLVFSLGLVTTTNAQKQHDLEGRWDLEIQFMGKTAPSWLEVRHSGHETLVGRFGFLLLVAHDLSLK